MKIIIIFLLIFYPFNSFAKYEVVKQSSKKQYESKVKYNNNNTTIIDIETTTAAYFENQNNIKDCPVAGSRTTTFRNSKYKVEKALGYFKCVENNLKNDQVIESNIMLEEGLIYYYKKHPRSSLEDIRMLLKMGVIKKNQNNPIVNAEIYIQKDDKTTYSFYILKSDVHYQNYNSYLNVALSVHEKRRKNEIEWYRMTEPRQYGLNQIKNEEVKKLYNTLFEVEKHFLKFDKKKFKPKKLDPKIVDYLLSIKPTSNWEYITRAEGN